MEFISLHIEGIEGIARDILMYRLSEEGFESFEEKENELWAFAPAAAYQEEVIHTILEEYGLKAAIATLPVKNWNQEWEKHFDPVEIAGKCFIRAPFHSPRPDYPFEIIIEPKMSFGTAHHETTSMMLEIMLEMDFQGKTVLDMGCGTGILAVLAAKMMATHIVAIDHDEWAYSNAIENVQKNNAGKIIVIRGGKSEIPSMEFDIVLANINRNILLDQIPHYNRHLKRGGLLLMSGFYESDLEMIDSKANSSGMERVSFLAKNLWVAAKYIK